MQFAKRRDWKWTVTERVALKPQNEDIYLDALRVAAAWLVVLGHTRALMFENFGSEDTSFESLAFYSLTSLGHQAVIIFFVLSGYWVGGKAWASERAGTFRFDAYLIDRIVRLWVVLLPALVLTVVVDAIGGALMRSSSQYNGESYNGILGDGLECGVLDFLGNALFLQGIAVKPCGTNEALWSISYEFWFYILMSLLLMVFRAGSIRWWSAAAAIVVIAEIGAMEPMILLYFPLWLIGVGSAHASHRNSCLNRLTGDGRASVLIGSPFVLVGIAATTSVISLPVVLEDYVLAIVTSFVIAATAGTCVRRSRSTSRARSTSWVGRRADESYTLYAIHLPCVVLISAVIVPFARSRFEVNVLSLCVYVAVIAVLAFFAHAFARLTELERL